MSGRFTGRGAWGGRASYRDSSLKLGVVGVACVEFFLTKDDRVLVNEIAPRTHNSGHLTIEACPTSQFEQQVRAICGLPLGVTTPLAPAAMANLLGDCWQSGEPLWGRVFEIPGAGLHLYGRQSQGRAERWATLQLQPVQQTKPSHWCGRPGKVLFLGEAIRDRGWLRQRLGSLWRVNGPSGRFDSKESAAKGKPLHCQKNAYCEWVKEALPLDCRKRLSVINRGK